MPLSPDVPSVKYVNLLLLPPPHSSLTFSSHHLRYILCPKCHHLNSELQETEEFAHKIYVEDDYAQFYREESPEAYNNRIQSIYIPKAQFLINSLKNDGMQLADIDLLDDGAGSGYFVRAMQQLGARAEGIEISSAQVNFANRLAGKPILKQLNDNDIPNVLRTTTKNIVSAIGVLEHIIDLDQVLDAISQNQHIQYLFISVPMFSYSVILEASHQSCYNRHLGEGHTHLFSDRSLQYMANRLGFEINATWKFGSDIMDLYRFICVTLEQNGNSELKDYFSEKFLPLIDDLQLIIDKSEFASETHMLLRRSAKSI